LDKVTSSPQRRMGPIGRDGKAWVRRRVGLYRKEKLEPKLS
jgi:hypothetical protein